ncbi:unnamed protein product [Natator depressus]
MLSVRQALDTERRLLRHLGAYLESETHRLKDLQSALPSQADSDPDTPHLAGSAA